MPATKKAKSNISYGGGAIVSDDVKSYASDPVVIKKNEEARLLSANLPCLQLRRNKMHLYHKNKKGWIFPAFFVPTPVKASCLNPNKCKRPAYFNHFTKPEKRHAIIGIGQRDADSGLGASRTFEPAGVLAISRSHSC